LIFTERKNFFIFLQGIECDLSDSTDLLSFQGFSQMIEFIVLDKVVDVLNPLLRNLLILRIVWISLDGIKDCWVILNEFLIELSKEFISKVLAGIIENSLGSFTLKNVP